VLISALFRRSRDFSKGSNLALLGFVPTGVWHATPELNHHPDRGLPRLDASVQLEEFFLGVEHQALVALPKSRGILFGIRVATHPLAKVKTDPIAQVRLRRALETMPEAMAVYKGIATARERILEMLSA